MTLAERSAFDIRPFERGADLIGGLVPQTAALVLAAACDLSLVVDDHGVLRDLSVGVEDIDHDALRAWLGRPLRECVAPDSRDKLGDLLGDAAQEGPARWRHLNHALPDGSELPVRYRALRLRGGRTLLLGRELRGVAGLQQRLTQAELAMARDYARISSAEGRYRMLFQTSPEPVLVADPSGLRTIEANPAMANLFRRRPRDVAGLPVLDLFQPASREAAEALLAAVRLTARGEDIEVKVRDRDETYRLSAVLFRHDNTVRILMRLLPVPVAAQAGEQSSGILSTIVHNMPDGFVLTGLDRRIRVANTAFLESAQLSIAEQAKGEPIDRWLGRTDVDVDVIMGALREKGIVRQFATVLRGEYGARDDVEVSAVLIDDSSEPCIGFTLRLCGPRFAPLAPGAAGGDQVQRLAELVGHVPLKSLVRETTDQVERRCIETALVLTRNNRAGAADMLGVSRQSLYAKMRRYGLIGDDEADADADAD